MLAETVLNKETEERLREEEVGCVRVGGRGIEGRGWWRGRGSGRRRNDRSPVVQAELAILSPGDEPGTEAHLEEPV